MANLIRKSALYQSRYIALPAPAQIIFAHIRQYGLLSSLGRVPEAIYCMNPRAYLGVSRALAMPTISKIKEFHPRVLFKYFGHYLSTSFDAKTRAVILANHYRFLNGYVSDKFIGMICGGEIQLWSKNTEIGDLCITLAYPAGGHAGFKEGELALRLWHGSRLIYTLSFAISPGFILGIPEAQAIFVARMQGARGGTQLFRTISKSLHEVSPQSLLLAATEGIASALKLQAIVGINARTQICLQDSNLGSHAYSVYDEFWLSIGALKLENGMYYLTKGVEEKPLHEIKSKHRSRTKRKRQFKQSLTAQVALIFKENCFASPSVQM